MKPLRSIPPSRHLTLLAAVAAWSLLSGRAPKPSPAWRVGLTAEEFHTASTKGVRLLSESDPLAFLRPGGRLAAVIDHTDRLLRQSGQIKGPDRRDGVITVAFASQESAP